MLPNLSNSILAALLLAAFATSAGGAPPTPSPPNQAHEDISISVRNHELIASQDEHRKVKLEVERGLQAAIRNSDSVFVLSQPPGSTSPLAGQLLILTKTASQTKNPRGYCGAGSSDILRLISIDKSRKHLVQLDQLTIQSCEQDISLADDSGLPVEKVLMQSLSSDRPMLTWLSHPTLGSEPKELRIEDGKFILK